MGCGGSKEGKKDDKKIDSEFATIKIGRYDTFFQDASALLSAAEDLRSGVEDSKEEGAELAQTWQLKEPKYIDTVQVLFWSASAENKGEIKNTKLEVMKEAPFVRMDPSKINKETAALYDTFNTYIKTVIDGPSKLKEIVEKLQAMSEQASGLVTEGKTEIQASSLDFAGKAQAVAKLGKNAAKLPKELAKCKNLQEILTQAATDMKELVPKLMELSQKADEVGAKASADGLTKPAEIFEKYHPGPKKTPKEIEAERKAQEKEAAAAKAKEQKK